MVERKAKALVDPPETISASFRNSLNQSEHWTVKDLSSGKIVIDQTFEAHEEVTALIEQLDGSGYGEVEYWNKDQEDPCHRGFISDEDVVDLL